jgi:hypothetical protein
MWWSKTPRFGVLLLDPTPKDCCFLNYVPKEIMCSIFAAKRMINLVKVLVTLSRHNNVHVSKFD